MINAEEARKISRANRNYDMVMTSIYDAVRKAGQEGKFSVKVKPGYDFKFTCWKELELHGFKVEDVKQGIYPTGEIEIKW